LLILFKKLSAVLNAKPIPVVLFALDAAAAYCGSVTLYVLIFPLFK
jgi:hypothetical protein